MSEPETCETTETCETIDPPCLAARWHGEPTIEGPHPSHFFTYGPDGMYTGHCGGR